MASRSFSLRRFFVINSALGLLCLVAVGWFIVQANQVATAGYEMRAAEQRLHELEGQKREHEMFLAEAESLERVSRAVVMMGFVPASAPAYLFMPSSAVAVR